MFLDLCGQITVKHIRCIGTAVESYMTTEGDMDQQRFVSNLKTEIKRRIESGRLGMSRSDIEQICKNVQMSSAYPQRQ
jgi:hypothetical protein